MTKLTTLFVAMLSLSGCKQRSQPDIGEIAVQLASDPKFVSAVAAAIAEAATSTSQPIKNTDAGRLRIQAMAKCLASIPRPVCRRNNPAATGLHTLRDSLSRCGRYGLSQQ